MVSGEFQEHPHVWRFVWRIHRTQHRVVLMANVYCSNVVGWPYWKKTQVTQDLRNPCVGFFMYSPSQKGSNRAQSSSHKENPAMSGKVPAQGNPLQTCRFKIFTGGLGGWQLLHKPYLCSMNHIFPRCQTRANPASRTLSIAVSGLLG